MGLTRIVRLTFKPSSVNEFLAIFDASKKQIRAFEGCQHLVLMKDLQQENIFYTYSIWQSDTHLQLYRKSHLFEETWSKTKALFADKPLAYTLETMEIVS
jgi:heme oxygenase (mycobilin-producing)